MKPQDIKHEDIHAMALVLLDIGESAEAIVRMLEKPWKWADEMGYIRVHGVDATIKAYEEYGDKVADWPV